MGKDINVLIIGGVACGAKTAARLRRLNPQAKITILEKGTFLSYAGCGIPYYIEGLVEDVKELMSTPLGIVRDANFFKKTKEIDVLTKHLATKIDRKNKKVYAVDLNTNQEKEFSYDKLVIATGSSPFVPPIPGKDLNKVFTVSNIDDAIAIKETINNGNIKKAVLIGGGLIGIEMVEALSKNGIEVSIVEILPYPLPKLLDEDFGKLLEKALKEKGVNFYGEEKVVEIIGDENGNVKAVKTDKQILDADMVIIAVGVRPNSQLAKDAGLEIGKFGGIIVNEHMQTSDPDIYAGGDCVECINYLTGKYTYQPMGSVANRHGRVIADNIAGLGTKFKGVLGTWIAKVFDTTVGGTGLLPEKAKEFGFDPVSVIITTADKPHFYPGNAPITIKLVADKNTRRIIGAELIGKGVVDKRLDVIATAITGNLTADDLADTDIAYAPPYSTALDAVTHAANTLRNKLDGLLKSNPPSEVKKKLETKEDFLLLDVRTPKEIKQMKLPYENVVYIPLGEVKAKAEQLPKNKEIMPFCKISLRGWEAYSILKGIGFERLTLLEGGIVAWPYEIKKGDDN